MLELRPKHEAGFALVVRSPQTDALGVDLPQALHVERQRILDIADPA
jgi:hypothetical protein